MTRERPLVVIAATDPPWPPTSGGDLRIVAITQALAAWADVVPVVFPLLKQPALEAMPDGAIVHPSDLPGPFARVRLRAAGLARGRHPFLEHLVRTQGPDKLATDLARIRPDVLVLTYPLTGPFLKVAAGSGSSLVFDLDTSHRLVDRRQLSASRGVGVLKSALDLLVAGPMERGLERLPDEIWVSSPVSAADLARRVRRPILLVPNTVDVGRYARYRREIRPGVCTFVGSFDYEPNRTAATRLIEGILPILRRSRPDARVRIVGRSPPGSIRSLASKGGVQLFADATDPWELLSGVGPLVVPLTAGGGTRLKVIEAIAAGVPVVGTRVAFEGLDLEPDRHVLVADGDDQIAAAVIRTWDEPRRTATRIAAALQAVTASYDVGVLTPTIGEAIRRLVPGSMGSMRSGRTASPAGRLSS